MTPRRAALAAALALALVTRGLAGDALPPLGPPPAELAKAFDLSPRYVKHVAVRGFPVVGTASASDAALREAAWLIERMLGGRPDLLDALAAERVRFVVMAPTEMTTDVPEHADLTPRAYWDRRARGLGATTARRAVSCGEENLLGLRGDPYAAENILVHELSHAVHELALARVDASFDARLAEAYAAARAAGRWAGTYASTNHREYWAEGAQSWFDTNRVNDAEHGEVATRAQVVAHDPPLAALLREVLGDGPWRYRRLADREPADRAHVAGFDAAAAPAFAWPERAAVGAGTIPLALEAAAPGPSPSSSTPATLEVVNSRKRTLTVEWVDFEGTPVSYAEVRPGTSWLEQRTFVGHVWRVREGDELLGYARVVAGDGRLEVR